VCLLSGWRDVSYRVKVGSVRSISLPLLDVAGP
jgi:hypothetical protein